MDWDPFADPADAENVEKPGEDLAHPRSDLLELNLSPVTGRKLRMLCLHGTCSNSAITKLQLATLSQLGKDKMELIYSDGQLLAPDDEVFAGQRDFMLKLGGGAELREYVRYRRLEDGSIDVNRRYDGIDEALQHLAAFCKANSPIDGVFGFSQGSNIASLLVAKQLSQGSACMPDLRFVIHNCTAIPGWVDQRPELFEHKLKLPCLVVGGGDNDVEVDGLPRRWRDIGDLYESPEFLEHQDGHQPLPASRDGKTTFAHHMLRFACASAGIDYT